MFRPFLYRWLMEGYGSGGRPGGFPGCLSQRPETGGHRLRGPAPGGTGRGLAPERRDNPERPGDRRRDRGPGGRIGGCPDHRRLVRRRPERGSGAAAVAGGRSRDGFAGADLHPHGADGGRRGHPPPLPGDPRRRPGRRGGDHCGPGRHREAQLSRHAERLRPPERYRRRG